MRTSDLYKRLSERRSVRGYLDTPVDRTTVEHILRAARHAPSGANLQPGGFHVLTGAPFETLKTTLADARAAGRPEVSEYSYFPNPMPADLKARQRAAGFALYEALGVTRRDIAGRKAQFEQNYRFFDAPVGIVVTIHRDMGKGCFMDLGMALMALFLAVEDAGLAASGIGALANHGDLVHDTLGLSGDEMVVCGIALGHADPDAPVNSVRTTRAGLDEYATFAGFDD